MEGTAARACAFTGHRPSKLPFGFEEGGEAFKKIQAALRQAVSAAIEDGYTHFISGMALGFDIWAAEAVLGQKQAGKPVTLEAAVPFSGQESRWSAENKARYRRILSCCDRVTVLSNSYSPYALHRRNMYMADSASRIIALYAGAPGGTENTLEYAKRRGLEIVRIELF